MNALTLSATRRRRVVILGPLDLTSRHTFSRPSAGQLLRRAAAFTFSPAMMAAVGLVCLATILWSDIVGDEALAGRCLLAAPWAIVWAYRASRELPEEGGER